MCFALFFLFFFFFKQKTAYEMRISDWSSDVCSSDLVPGLHTTAEDTPDAARAKGSLKMLEVLAAAVADRQRTPEEPLPIKLADVTVEINAEAAAWAIEEAREAGDRKSPRLNSSH